MNSRSFLAARAKRARGADGFSIVEVMVALVVVMLAAVTLALVMTNAVTAVSLGQQSQAASNLAASVAAEAEALPWATLEEGLSGTDPNLVTDEKSGGNVGQATGSGTYYCYEGQPLFVSGAGNLASAASAPQCPTVVKGVLGGPGITLPGRPGAATRVWRQSWRPSLRLTSHFRPTPSV